MRISDWSSVVCSSDLEFLVSDGFFNDGPYPHRDDDTRMLKDVGAKFVGRAIYSWNVPEHFNNPEFLGKAEDRILDSHALDPDIIFKAAIFETVSTKVRSEERRVGKGLVFKIRT